VAGVWNRPGKHRLDRGKQRGRCHKHCRDRGVHALARALSSTKGPLPRNASNREATRAYCGLPVLDGATSPGKPGTTPPSGPRQPDDAGLARLALACAHRYFAEEVAEAATRLVTRLRVPAEHRLGSATAEDIRARAVHAAWRAALQDPARFFDGHARGAIDEAHLAAYLSCHLRKGLDELRREQRDEVLDEVVGCTHDGEREAMLAEQVRELKAAIASLPPRGRKVVERRQRGWSYRRIGNDLGLRRNTAIQRYRRALYSVPVELRALLPEAHERGLDGQAHGPTFAACTTDSHCARGGRTLTS